MSETGENGTSPCSLFHRRCEAWILQPGRTELASYSACAKPAGGGAIFPQVAFISSMKHPALFAMRFAIDLQFKRIYSWVIRPCGDVFQVVRLFKIQTLTWFQVNYLAFENFGRRAPV